MAVGPSSPTTARVSDLLRYPSKVAPVTARSWWSPVRSRARRVNCSASQAPSRPVRVSAVCCADALHPGGPCAGVVPATDRGHEVGAGRYRESVGVEQRDCHAAGREHERDHLGHRRSHLLTGAGLVGGDLGDRVG